MLRFFGFLTPNLEEILESSSVRILFLTDILSIKYRSARTLIAPSTHHPWLVLL
jgi:hypothetical protein